MGRRLNLFDDDGVNDDVEEISKVEIDQEFARRFEHNKKREDFQRLKELQMRGLAQDSDDEEEEEEEEEEEDNIKSKKKDLEFFDALIRVRNQDPVLKDKEAKLFHSESEDEEENQTDNYNDNDKNEGKKKQLYLKDVVSRQLIENGPEVDTDSEDEKEEEVRNVKSYSEEQDELKKELLKAAGEPEEGDELLKERQGRDEENDDEDDEMFGEKLDEYFGEDEKLDEDSKFLKDYFKNRLWEGKGEQGEGDEEIEFSEDEDAIEMQEDYEREFNFRFEEGAGDRVMGHSRKVDGSVRMKPNARKLQRDRKEERMAMVESERKEELKRLKNLKKKEINEKLQKIRETAGIYEDGDCKFDEDYFDEEFDPEEHDRKMKQAFGVDYYLKDDVDPDFGSDHDEDEGEVEKPDFDKEDELLGLPKGWDDLDKPRKGFVSVRESILKKKIEGVGDNKQEEGEEDVAPEEGKRKRKKKKPSEVEKAREELMEEYYELDYEDTIGDLKTRFKYKPVKPKRFKLKPEELLMMDDKELNQYIPLKKLAPYREKEWKVPLTKEQELKKRSKELLRGESSNGRKADKKRKRDDDQEATTMLDASKSQEQKNEDVTADTNYVSRKSKRKHNQAEFKLSSQRLKAYGKNF